MNSSQCGVTSIDIPNSVSRNFAPATWWLTVLARWGYAVDSKASAAPASSASSGGARGASVGLRADMDALPILEETGLP